MRIWFDTEFIDDGRTIDLISIGMFREDGGNYYAEAAECDLSRACPWVKAHVLPLLNGIKKPRAQIAQEIVAFVGPEPQFWGYYADYDWVALCQLYGRMIDVPKGWPMFCLDFKQLAGPGYGMPPKKAAHNAWHDAKLLMEEHMRALGGRR